MRRGTTLISSVSLGLVLFAAAFAFSQRSIFDRFRRHDPFDIVETERPSIVPSFEFARVRFTSYREGRRPGWSHDFPRAERNLLSILSQMTGVYTEPRAHAVVELASPELMNYPILYFSEPGGWAITPEEAENLRSYLIRGGFAIFDDFDGPWDWENFENAMALVLPGSHFVELTVDEPVFQSFFHIATLDMVPPYGAYAAPTFHGLKDEAGRLQVVANFNNDIGDYWEWSDAGYYPIELSNEGFKFGVNYVIYAMMH